MPDRCYGKVLDPVHQGYPSTSAWPVAVLKGEAGAISSYPPQWFVDVQDAARLHVAALVHPAAKEERIFAFAEQFNFNDKLAALRRIYPHRNIMPDVPNQQRDRTTVLPRDRAERLLRDMGREGWTSLEHSLRLNTESVEA